MVSIKNNLNSNTVIGNLGKNRNLLSDSVQKLSSGLRINKASDDAAGLHLADGNRADKTKSAQGLRNVNDSLSLFQIASEATQEITNITIRLKELAQQASSEATGSDTKIALNKEKDQLEGEIIRIIDTTTFNGKKVLTGEFTSASNSVVTTNTLANPTVYGVSADGERVMYQTDLANSINIADTSTGAVLKSFTDTNHSAMSANGSVVLNDLSGGVGDLIYYDADTDTSTAFTTSANALDATTFAISADGSTIAFNSYTYYNSDGSVSGSGATQRIYTYDTNSGQFSEINVGGTNVVALQLSADGSQLAFRSTTDITGQNADNNQEVFHVEVGGDASDITQLTVTTATEVLYLSGVTNEGAVILNSTRDLTGENAANNAQLYSVSASGIDQLTSNTDATENFRNSYLSANDQSVVFYNNLDLTGNNSDGGDEFYRLDLGTGTYTQLTNLVGGSIASFRVASDGSHILSQGASPLKLDMYEPEARTQDFSTEAAAGAGYTIDATITAVRSAMSLGGFTLTNGLADEYLEQADQALDQLGSVQGQLTAVIGRLESTASLLANQTENYGTAESVIRDADIAFEMAQFTKYQILENAGVAMAAQANIEPRTMVSLLEEA